MVVNNKTSLRFPGAQTDLMIMLIFIITVVAKRHDHILGLLVPNIGKM